MRSRGSATGASLDLLALAWALSVAAALLPERGPLGARDGAGIATLAVSAAAALWGRPLGAGPHPALLPRPTRLGAPLRALSRGLAPWALWAALAAWRGAPLWLPAALLVATALSAWIARDHGRTAWSPGPRARLARLRADARLLTPFVAWSGLGLALVILACASLATLSRGPLPTAAAVWLTPALVAAQLLLVSALSGRVQNLRQRAQLPGPDESLPRFGLAALGPGLSLLALGALMIAIDPLTREGAGPRHTLELLRDLGFEAYERPMLVMCVVVWARLLWAPRPPVSALCHWHEVLPSSGGGPTQRAEGFERPPEGVLQLDAWRLRATGALASWAPPVQQVGWSASARSPELWPASEAPQRPNLLGQPVFEPDPATGAPQAEALTVRRLSGDNQTLSLTRATILSPLRATADQGTRSPWRWAEAQDQRRTQVVGGNEPLILMDGDVLVLSAEGSARAWRLEIGARLLAGDPLARARLPAAANEESS